MGASTFFSDEDRNRIQDAVEAAETRTSGEIVPVIVKSSADYGFVKWKAAFFGVLLGLAVFELITMQADGWSEPGLIGALGVPLMIGLGAGLMVLLVRFLPVVRRRFIPQSAIDVAVHNRALRAFLEHEVFGTRERTGILLLVSLFEHRVEVVGDSGINEKVSEDDWADVVSDIVRGIKSGQPTDGIVKAVERCGELLESAGVAIRSDDTNELSNVPRFEE